MAAKFNLLDWRPLGPIADYLACTAGADEEAVCCHVGAAPVVRRGTPPFYSGEAACAEHASLPLRLRLLTIRDPF